MNVLSDFYSEAFSSATRYKTLFV